MSEDEDEVKPKKRGRPPSASLTEKKKPTRIGKTKPTSEVKLVNKDATAAGEDSGELSDIPSDFYDTPIKKRRTSASKQKPKASPKAKKAAPEHVIEEDVIEEDETVEGNGVAAGGLSGNESEMSVLIDEEPPKKKPRARKAATGEPKKKAKTPVKAKPKKEKTPVRIRPFC